MQTFTHGLGAQPFSPNVLNCATKPSITTLATSETLQALRRSSIEVTPREGWSATLHVDGTRANHVKVWIKDSVSTKFSAKESTTKLLQTPRNKANLQPSLSTKRIHLRPIGQ